MNHKPLHIDSALQQRLDNYLPNDGWDYAGFLDKLAEHNKNNVLIDDVLEQTNTPLQYEFNHSWKKIIAIIWYRRIRNTGLIILLCAGLGYGIHHFWTNDTQISQVSAQPDRTENIYEDKNDIAEAKTALAEPKNLSNTLSQEKRHPFIQKDTFAKTIESIAKTTRASIPESEENFIEPKPHTALNIDAINALMFPTIGLKKLLHPDFTQNETIHTLSFYPVNSRFKNKQANIRNLPASGLIIGLNLIYSAQNYRSNMVSNNSKTVNRNYRDLSVNGRIRSQVINYGLSIEKSIFKGIGLSIGINKFTLLQEQKTNYILTEAPVYDLDGNIAGYILIKPESIQVRIQNRINYISVPLYLTYKIQINHKNSLQLKAGSSILSQMNEKTEKFDYKSLDLNVYHHSTNPFSMNNVQYGLSYTRNLPHRLLLSLGIERQNLGPIHAWSDQTEKTKSTLNNLIISLQYKL